ncbi:MAG: GDP-mannose 4,6-dehydratase [Nitrospira sp.]|jgi:nucleoside-diphosphate-sugar epimerase|nr:GDP-mannose 4,6-dehydratase [Nitrospira sp.]
MSSMESAYPGRRLLVFGSGFIASRFARYARDLLGWQVGVVYRNFRNPDLEELYLGRLPEDQGSLAKMISAFAPTDTLIAVGSSFVPAINRDIGGALDEHLNTTVFIFNAHLFAPSVTLNRMLVIGSASEYGVFDDEPVCENHPTRPQDAYGVIKLAQYQLGLHYSKVYKLPVVHVRQFNVTGPGQTLRFVVPSICSQAAKHAACGVVPDRPCRIIAGNTAVRRDFLAIDDVCAAYARLFDQGEAGEAYNVCSGITHSINELIDIASASVGLKLEVEVSQDLVRENERVRSIICGSPRKLLDLGWRPGKPMEKLIPEMISYYKEDEVFLSSATPQ